MKKNKLLFLAVLLLLSQPIVASEQDKILDPTIIPVKTQQPKEKKIYPIVIIGAGAAGTMAVKRAVLNNYEVLLFTGAKQEQRRSRGNWVKTVDNIPGLTEYKRTVLELRNEVLTRLFHSSLGYNLYVIEESVIKIEKKEDFFELTDGFGRTYYGKYVVLATGIMDEQPLIQGSIRPILKYANGQTVVYCVLCDGHRSFGKKTVVIGHLESAGDTAFYLAEKYQLASTTVLTNGQPHQFTSGLLKQLEEKQIKIFEAPIQEVLGNREEKRLTGFKLETGDVVEAEIGFVALGIRPNNQLALQLGAQVSEYGLVLTDANGETSVAGLFVIGDLRANSMKQIYTAWNHAVEVIQSIDERM